MERMDGAIVCFSVILVSVLSSSSMAVEGYDHPVSLGVIGTIGVITDSSSRAGREEKIAMEIAVDDFYNLTGNKLALELRDLSGVPANAFLNGKSF